MSVQPLHDKKLQELLLKRDALLKDNPFLQKVQASINDALAKAGSRQGNRCHVINDMLLKEANELNSVLKGLVEDVKVLEDLVDELRKEEEKK